MGKLFLVVNAGCKEADFALMREALAGQAELRVAEDRALLALQGPQAAAVMARALRRPLSHCPSWAPRGADFDGIAIHVSRAPAIPARTASRSRSRPARPKAVWDALMADERVKPVGLGARDSLRLEAGLCLYGHDIDATTSPVEAGLAWSIQKRRREGGGFQGADRVRRELMEGASRLRVGLLPDGSAPVREGARIKNEAGEAIGTVTSGGFGPTVGGPVAMGYVERAFASAGTPVLVELRGRDVPTTIAAMPFTPHHFHRG